MASNIFFLPTDLVDTYRFMAFGDSSKFSSIIFLYYFDLLSMTAFQILSCVAFSKIIFLLLAKRQMRLSSLVTSYSFCKLHIFLCIGLYPKEVILLNMRIKVVKKLQNLSLIFSLYKIALCLIVNSMYHLYEILHLY